MRTLLTALLATLFLSTLVSAADNAAPKYQVYAIRYAQLPDFPVAGLVAGADR